MLSQIHPDTTHAPDERLRVLEKIKREAGFVVVSALRENDVVEVLLNADGRLWVDSLGGGMRMVGYMGANEAYSFIGSVAASLGLVVSPEQPVLEGNLILDGSRFHGMVPPVVQSPIFSIRKQTSKVLSLDHYVCNGNIESDKANHLREAIRRRKNILISGGTSSGKTTLVNALIAEIANLSPDHRVAILEDTPELLCESENYIALRSGEMSPLHRLLKSVLRLRPDRIVVGEVRGAEALTLLKAWNTGHPGGVSTIHANSARAALTRLEQLVAEVSVMPVPHIIGDAIDLIVHLERSAIDGVRRVVEVLAVEGYGDGEYLVTPIERVKR